MIMSGKERYLPFFLYLRQLYTHSYVNFYHCFIFCFLFEVTRIFILYVDISLRSFQMSSSDSWHALESDPDLWHVYMEKLGVDASSLNFIEIYSLDEDYPPDETIYAFVFLYPDNGSLSSSNVDQPLVDDKLWTIKQIEELDSCCCLIALLHAIGNNLDKVILKPNSPLAEFFEKTKTMTADERAITLLNDTQIHQAHEETAEQGQTEMVDGDRVGYHYIAYIQSKSNKLYELNGSTRGPQAKFIRELNKESFYAHVTREIKEKVNELDGDIRFNLIGLATK